MPNYKHIACEVCSDAVRVDTECDRVICGRCVITQVYLEERKRVKRMSDMDPQKARRIRKDSGLTQKHLSGIIGVSVSAIRDYEKGRGVCAEKHYGWLKKGNEHGNTA